MFSKHSCPKFCETLDMKRRRKTLKDKASVSVLRKERQMWVKKEKKIEKWKKQ